MPQHLRLNIRCKSKSALNLPVVRPQPEQALSPEIATHAGFVWLDTKTMGIARDENWIQEPLLASKIQGLLAKKLERAIGGHQCELLSLRGRKQSQPGACALHSTRVLGETCRSAKIYGRASGFQLRPPSPVARAIFSTRSRE